MTLPTIDPAAPLNGPGQPKTWRCTCGHQLYLHSPQRDAMTREYYWGQCNVPGCTCARCQSEYDAAKELAAA